MPNFQKILLFVLIVALTITTSCVSKKKYDSAIKGKSEAESRAKSMHGQLSTANVKIAELEGKVAQLEKDVMALQERLSDCEGKRVDLQNELADTRAKGSEVYRELQQLKSSSSAERQKLDAALKKKSEDLDAREKSISELLDKLETREKALADLQKQLEAREKKVSDLQMEMAAREKASTELQKELEARELRIKELQERIDARDKAMNDLRNKLLNALTGYQKDDLSVELRDGKVYIAISDKMLFKSGSAKVEQAGKDALAKVATVLNKYQDMDLIIEGHTDSLPIKTAQFADNWDLSVIRATSVVRILTQEYGMSAARVMPAGRGEFFPKASNTTPEGRSKNRRTEIIIVPKLDAIEEMLKK